MVHPSLLSEMSIDDINVLFQNYLIILYAQVHAQRVKTTITTKNVSETYGEILYPSIDKLITEIPFTEHDVFVDLGSGKGQIVIQVFLKSRVRAAYGIEIISELHKDAAAAAQILQQQLPCFYENQRQLTFFSGSFLEIPFDTATIALINSTCFSQSLLNQLGTILNNTPGIHTVFSLRPIHTLQRLKFKKVIRVECSWDSALCYLYTSII